MKEFRISAIIPASAEKIWGILTRASDYPKWNKGVAKIEGNIALGEKITVHTTFNPNQAFPVKVSTFEPARKMVWTGGMPLGLFKGERTYTLVDQGDGTTEFRMHEVFSGLLSPLIGRTIPDLNPSFQQYVDGLKEQVTQE